MQIPYVLNRQYFSVLTLEAKNANVYLFELKFRVVVVLMDAIIQVTLYLLGSLTQH
jgi:hypothetical protein